MDATVRVPSKPDGNNGQRYSVRTYQVTLKPEELPVLISAGRCGLATRRQHPQSSEERAGVFQREAGFGQEPGLVSLRPPCQQVMRQLLARDSRFLRDLHTSPVVTLRRRHAAGNNSVAAPAWGVKMA